MESSRSNAEVIFGTFDMIYDRCLIYWLLFVLDYFGDDF